MHPPERCARCGSADILPDLRVEDRGADAVARNDLTVSVEADRLFRAPPGSQLRAHVCGACGYTELFAVSPERLLAGLARQARAHLN
jgi:ribosomal protein S27AE